MILSDRRVADGQNLGFGGSRLGQRIFAGEIVRAKGLVAARSIAAMIRVSLAESFYQYGDPRTAQLPAAALMQMTQNLSENLVASCDFHLHCASILRGLGFDLSHVVANRPRLRCTPISLSDERLDPYIYSAHRDTWFAEPEAQVNIWMSPYTVNSDQTFVFFPDYFQCPVSNSSETFDLEAERRERSGAHPVPTSLPLNGRVGFAADASELIIFSASHLHQTIRNSSAQHRFALQLRVVDIRDICSQTARLRIDNSSSGSTFNIMRSMSSWIAAT